MNDDPQPIDDVSPPSAHAPRGAGYVARTRLTNKPGTTVFAEVGQTCERVPERSLPWLIARRLIVPTGEV